ncbi:hypothetical protein TNCV_2460521 [Trichonephila clavipes]|nr:hypothetical protein TNCV_2460521 [Trichonephila clavipes]
MIRKKGYEPQHLKTTYCVRFSGAKNAFASDIYSQIVEVYGEEAMSRQHVAKLCHPFHSDIQEVENSNIAESGRPSCSTTEINKARI